MGENPRNIQKYKIGCPPIPQSAKMEADCFPVSENKPDLL